MHEVRGPAAIEITVGGATRVARVLDERAPHTAGRLRDILPLSARMVQDEWSGAVLRSMEVTPSLPAGDVPAPYQYPGLLVACPDGRIALCYGEGRLQDAFGPIRAVPVAEVLDFDVAFAECCRAVQFAGATEVAIRERSSTAAPEGSSVAPRITLALGRATASATLLVDASPVLLRSFRSLLPLKGRATNTYSSGPLTRFWNDDGGPEGETPMEYAEAEAGAAHRVLRPGHIYYQPERPWRGIRIPLQDATTMRGALGGAGLRLLPLARLEGDWSAVAAEARGLIEGGARPMRLTDG